MRIVDAFDHAFSAIDDARENFNPRLKEREIGIVESLSTGIARISGLPGVGFEEVLKFPGDLYGIAFNIDENEIGAVLLGDYWQLHAGGRSSGAGM